MSIAERTLPSFQLLLLSLFLAMPRPSDCLMQTHYIHWNTSNPMFTAALPNSPVIDIGVGAHHVAQANIICPLYSADQNNDDDVDDLERLVVYNVSRDEFEHCKLMSANPRAVAVCDRPTQPAYFTLTFRPYSPTPGGFEFAAGLDYYFISTSSREDIGARSGGYCKSHNLRLVFRMIKEEDLLKKQQDDLSQAQEPQELLQQPRAFPDWSEQSESSDSSNKTQATSEARSTYYSNSIVILVALICLAALPR